MQRLTGGLDGVGHILQAVAGDHGHHGGVLLDQPLLAGLLQRGGACDAGRLAEHAAGAAQQTLRGQDLLVRHAHGDTVGFTDGGQGLVGVPGHAHGNGVGDGVLLHGIPLGIVLNGPVDGIAAVGLGGNEPGQLVNEADGIQILEALPHTGDGAAVTHGDGQIVGHLPIQLLGNLQRHGLLALGEVGIDGGVAVIPAVLGNGLGGHLESLLIVALDGDDIGAEDHKLGHLALGGTLGNEDVGLEARGGGVAGQRGGGVAGGGAGDGPGAGLISLGNGHGGSTILQGGGGVLPVVLDPQLLDAQHFGQLRLLVQGAPTHTQGGVGGGLLHGQQLPVTPHGAVLALGQLFLGQNGLDIVVIIDNVQNAAALAVGQIGSRLIGLAAADALAVFHIFHGVFSLLPYGNMGAGHCPAPMQRFMLVLYSLTGSSADRWPR